MGLFAEDENDVGGISRLKVSSRSVLSLPTACGEGGLSRALEGVESVGPASGWDEDEAGIPGVWCLGVEAEGIS